MDKHILLQIVLIGVASLGAQWLAWRFRLPAILFLLGLGFALGPVTGLIDPHGLFGPALEPMVSAAVAIILFEGALQLNFKDIKESRRAIAHVIIIGGLLGWGLTTMGAHYVGGLDWATATVLGGMLVVTGPTVVIPMLRHARLSRKVSSVLKWESIINDAIGILFAVLAYEFFVARGNAGVTPGAEFFVLHALALMTVVAASFVSSFAITYLFEKGWVPEYLKAPFLLIFVLALFYTSNQLLYESGLIAVTILGIMMTNIYEQSIEEVKRFKETITILLVSGVFILLTANLDLNALRAMDWRALGFVIALLFLIRPVVMMISSIGSGLTWREALFIGWIAPRGVVLAVLAGILGPMLVEAGFPDGAQILPIAMVVVIVTVTLDSFLIGKLAHELKLSSPAGNGVILIGAHPWSTQFAELLQSRKVPVVIVDNNFTALREARLANVPTYYGDVLSEEAHHDLDMHQYNTLLAATYSPAYNAFAKDTIGREWGRERVFGVGLEKAEKSTRTKLSRSLRGNRWGSATLTAERLSTLFEEGWRFKIVRTDMTQESAQLMQEGENRMIMGVLSRTGVVQLYSADRVAHRLTLKDGDSLILFQKKDA